MGFKEIIKRYLDASWVKKTVFFLHLLALFALITDHGFEHPSHREFLFVCFYLSVLFVGISFTVLKYIYRRKEFIWGVFIFDTLSILFILYCLDKQLYTENFFVTSIWIRLPVFLKIVREFTRPNFQYKTLYFNPAQLFIFSFFSLILIGSLLLLLPKATNGNINFIDAVFTSTSAVCVTGLSAVDISHTFTQMGQSIILGLIQIGGLGILTFASYFSYFFKGGTSYQNQIAMSDLSNSEKIGEVFTTFKQILLITFIIESLGAVLIYFNLNSQLIPYFSDRLFFSIFHSISSFCNAGFSTLPKGLMNENFIHNYSLQFVIALIFIFGGLGFPIVINSVRYLKHLIHRNFLWFLEKKHEYKPWILTLSNKINLITTATLIVFGTMVIYIKEYYNVLDSHSGIGKFITAFFTATTPRTAGYNTIDFSQLHFSSILIIILLMWIGASPASTGGGVKTSSFAIAILNVSSLVRGKTNIEVFRREIADSSVRRAFAMISLSLLVTGTSILLISYYDNHLSLLDITFECFSAYSTVGLTLGITPDLSAESKIVLVGTMFIGRVGMLSLLVAFFKKAKQGNYSYPSDEILIN